MKCSKHGEQKVHIMRLNPHVYSWEFEALIFSCGCFVGGTINGKVYENADDFLKAFDELQREWRERKQLYHHFGFKELEELVDMKLGIKRG